MANRTSEGVNYGSLSLASRAVTGLEPPPARRLSTFRAKPGKVGGHHGEEGHASVATGAARLVGVERGIWACAQRAGEDPRKLDRGAVGLDAAAAREAGSAEAPRQVLRVRAGALCRHARRDRRHGQ